MSLVAIQVPNGIGKWQVTEEIFRGTFSKVYKVFRDGIVAEAKIESSKNQHSAKKGFQACLTEAFG